MIIYGNLSINYKVRAISGKIVTGGGTHFLGVPPRSLN